MIEGLAACFLGLCAQLVRQVVGQVDDGNDMGQVHASPLTDPAISCMVQKPPFVHLRIFSVGILYFPRLWMVRGGKGEINLPI
jgi:hypothetical protein